MQRARCSSRSYRISHAIFVPALVALGFFIAAALAAPSACAHSPVEGGGEHSTPEDAMRVADPAKSWAYYLQLPEGGGAYYLSMELQKGARLRAQLFIPAGEKGRFLPGMALLGPGLPRNETVPEPVEVPLGARAMNFPGAQADKPGYEPFTPTAYYYLADADITVSATGTYYVAVYGHDSGGKFGVAIGYLESFTPQEWVAMPFSLVSIHVWEGQAEIAVLSPVVTIVAVGFALAALYRRSLLREPQNTLGILAGLLFIGGACATLSQAAHYLSLGPSGAGLAWVSAIFIAVPLALGAAVIRAILKKGGALSHKDAATLVACGALGIFLWGGLLFGPVLCFIVALFPFKSFSFRPLPVERNLDLERYMGRWYEIARMPEGFEEGCSGTTATYALRPDGLVDVVNECEQGGRKSSARGVAKPASKKAKGILKVSFLRPFWGDYWVIEVGQDYDYAVVGTPSRRHLWILCRNRRMGDIQYSEIVARCQALGFDTGRLVKTAHA